MLHVVYPFTAIASGLRKWPFGYKFCQFNGFLSYLWVVECINILALTAINRYFCVVKLPMYPTLFTRKNTVLSIMFMGLFIFGLCLVATLVTATSYQWHPYYLFCQIVGVTSSAHTLHALAITFLTVFVPLPMCIILLCYGSVYHVIRRHNSAVIPSLQEANSQVSARAQEIQASRVLLAAVVAFCFSWISATIVIILENVVHPTIPPFWQSLHTLTAACSSWINPVIYGVMNRAMRIEFLKLLHCRNEN